MVVDSGSEGSSSSEEESRSPGTSCNGGNHAFTCNLCSYGTDRKNNLKRHAQTMHETSTTPLECCGVFFANKADLRAHTQGRHSDGYHCDVCSRVFCRKALLKRHYSVHSGYKEFSCRHCSYQTSHKSNLERHMRIHQRNGGSNSRQHMEAAQQNGHLAMNHVFAPGHRPVAYFHGHYPMVQAGPQWPMPPSPSQAGPLTPSPSAHIPGPAGMASHGAIPKVAKRKPCGFSVAELLKKEEDQEPSPAPFQQTHDARWKMASEEGPLQPAHWVFKPEPVHARDLMHSTSDTYTEAQAYCQPWPADAHLQGHYNPPTPPEDHALPMDHHQWTHGPTAEGEVDPLEPEYIHKKLRMSKKFKDKTNSNKGM